MLPFCSISFVLVDVFVNLHDKFQSRSDSGVAAVAVHHCGVRPCDRATPRCADAAHAIHRDGVRPCDRAYAFQLLA